MFGVTLQISCGAVVIGSYVLVNLCCVLFVLLLSSLRGLITTHTRLTAPRCVVFRLWGKKIMKL